MILIMWAEINDHFELSIRGYRLRLLGQKNVLKYTIM